MTGYGRYYDLAVSSESSDSPLQNAIGAVGKLIKGAATDLMPLDPLLSLSL
jgi:hypothetical protein